MNRFGEFEMRRDRFFLDERTLHNEQINAARETRQSQIKPCVGRVNESFIVGIAQMIGIRNAPWKEDEAKAITTLLAHVAFGAVVGLIYDEVVDEDA